MLESVVLKEWHLDPVTVLKEWTPGQFRVLMAARNRRVAREREAYEKAKSEN